MSGVISLWKKILLAVISIVILWIVFNIATAAFSTPAPSSPEGFNSKAVLGTGTDNLKGSFNVNVPAYFNDDLYLRGKLLTTGDASFSGTTSFTGDVIIRGERFEIQAPVTAPNIVYSVAGGNGITVSGTQEITLENTGVTAFQDRTGNIQLEAGTGIAIDGLRISSTVTSANTPDTFSTFSDGTNEITAGSSDDTLTFTAGTGIGLGFDTTNKNITITSTATSPITSVGNGLVLNSGTVSVAPITSAAGAGSTSSFSGLEFVGTEIGLIQGCADGELLKWNNTSSEWECAADAGGVSGIINVEENDVVVSASAGTLDFSGSDFILTQSPAGEINVALDYANSHITRDNQSQTISGEWTFGNTLTLSALSAGSGSLLCVDGTDQVVTCTGGGVTSLNGISGALSLANASGVGSTVTIDDASTSQKGIAQFNNTNFTASGGTINTIQNINSGASPTFTGLTLTSLTTAGIVHTNGSGVFSTSALNLAGGANEITGILPVANGGTGITTASLTGVPTLSSGTWSVNAQLSTALGGLGADVTAAGAGELLYSTGTTTFDTLPAGSPGLCLVSNGTAAPAWTSCSGATGITTYWDQVNGTIYPKNSTVDFLLGGTSTSSARFAVTGMNGGDPTASVSAGLAGSAFITASGSFATTNNQQITLGGPDSGGVTIYGLGTGVVRSTGGVISTGVVTNAELQNSSITVNGGTGLGVSGSPVSLGGTLTLSNTGVTSNIGGTGISVDSATGAVTISNTGVLSVVGGTSGSTVTGAITLSNAVSSGSTLTIDNASTTVKGIASFNATNFTDSSGAINTVQNINTAATPTFGGLTLSAFTGNNAVLFGTATTGVLSSATTGSSGLCLVSGASAPTWTSCSGATGITTYWDQDNGVLTPKNSTVDFLLGASATNSAKFAVLGLNGARGTQTATLSGSLTLDAAASLQTTNNQTLTIGGNTTGGIVIDSNTGLISLQDNTVISGSLTGLTSLTSAGTITFSGYNTNNGLLYTNGSGVLVQVGAGASGQCLIGNTGSAPTWGSCDGSSSVNVWDVANGTAKLGNTSLDLLVGGSTTASATFAIIGNNSSRGTQIASLSGSLVLDATGSLTTTNNQTLTIGGGATGNIVISGIGSGVVRSTGGVISTGVVTNAELQNSSITVNGGTGLGVSGSPVSLGGTLTLSNTGVTSNIAGNGISLDQGTGAVTITNTGVLSLIGGTSGSAVSGALTLNNAVSSGSTLTIDNASTTVKGIASFNSTNFTDSSGAINLIQNIHSAATPTFGGLTLSGFTGNNAVLYGTASTGVLASTTSNIAGQCLVSGASAPVWTDCGSASGTTNYFAQSSGALYVTNPSLDLLLGGSTTDSAKFAFTGVSQGTPTASISAGLSGALQLLADGTIATTNKQTLTFGGATTGNVNISLTSPSTLQLNGTTLFDASRNLYGVAGISTSLNPTAPNTFNLGTSTGDQFGSIYGNTVYQNGNQVCDTSGNCIGGGGGGVGGSGNANYISKFTSGSLIGNSQLYDTGTALALGNTTPIGFFSINGGYGANAALSVNQTGLGTDILTASASGTTRFVLDTSGNLNIIGGEYRIGGAQVLSSNTLGGAVVNSSLTSVGALSAGSIASGFGAILTTDTIEGSNITAAGTTGFIASGTGADLLFSGSGTHTISASSGTLELGAATLAGAINGNSQNISGLGTINGLAITPNTGTITTGTWNGTAIGSQYGGTGQNFASSTGVPSLSGGVWSVNATLPNTLGGTGIDTAGATGVPILSSGTWSIAATLGTTRGGLGADITAVGAGELLYSTGASTYDSLPAGASGNCLVSGGAGAPSWTSCAGATGITTYWDQVNGALTPKIATLDFLLGGTATDSAKFGILGLNNARGQQTATLSGSLVLDAAGSLTTTNNQTLTLGGGSTGNIVLGGFGTGVVKSTNGVLSTGVITNAELQNSSITVNGGTGLGVSGSPVSLGGTLTLSNTGVTSNIAGNGISLDQGTGAVTITNTGVLSIIGGSGGSSAITGALTLANSVSAGSTITIDNASTTVKGIASFNSTNFTDSSGAINLIQNIHSAATPTFGGLTLSAFTGTNSILYGTATTGVLATATTGTSGLCLVSGASAPTWTSCAGATGITTYWDQVNGALTPKISTLDLLLGGTTTESAKFGILNLNGTRGTQIASLSGSLTFDATGTIQSTNNQTLTVGGGSTGDLIIGRTSQSIMLPSLTTNGGLLYTTSTGVLSQIGAGSTGQCLLANTGAAPAWGSCDGAASVNVWEVISGTAQLGNTTLDLLVGGATSESAKFAILGVNNARGQQTASLSGSLVLDAAGSLQTTKSQTLTIGGSTTGNISLSPRNGTGFVEITSGDLRLTPQSSVTSTTEGSIYYDTDDDQLKVYSNGKWQADRSTATVIVGTSDATNPSKNYEKADFVADGSGGTDDTVAIEAAIAALPTTGGTVVLLEGDYYITSDIDIAKSNVTLTGAGRSTNIIRGFNETTARTTGMITLGNLANDFSAIKIANLQLDGLKATHTDIDNYGIFFSERVTSSSVENTYIHDNAGAGIYIGSSAAGGEENEYITITANEISGNGVAGITTYYNVTNSIISNNLIHSNVDGMYFTYNNSHITISNNVVRDNTDDGIEPYQNNTYFNISNNQVLSNTDFGIALSQSLQFNHTISNNTIDSSGTSGMYIYGDYHQITNNNITNSGAEGIRVYVNSSENIFSGNYFGDNAQSGITFNQQADYNTISNNRFHNNGASGNYDAIDLTTTNPPDYTVITGNYITDTAGSGYAISVSGDNNYLADNVFSGTGASSISITGTNNRYANQQLNSSNDMATVTSRFFGIGTTAPTSVLHVGGGNVGGNALAILNQTGVSTNDILAASSSGITRFVINNDGTASSSAGFTINGIGNIQSTNNQTLTVGGGSTGDLILGRTSQTIMLPSLITNGGLLYTTSTGVLSQIGAGSNGQCLLSSGAVPTWGSCTTASNSPFEVIQGAITQVQPTLDFLLGGTATTSAKFAILGLNNARGQQTASLSGSLTLDAAGNIQTTNNQNLTIGGNTTGNIFLAPNNGSGSVVINANSGPFGEGPLVIRNDASGTIGTGVTLDSSAVAGGRKYNVISTGGGASCGAGCFAVHDGTDGEYRFFINEDGNMGTVDGRFGVGMGSFNVPPYSNMAILRDTNSPTNASALAIGRATAPATANTNYGNMYLFSTDAVGADTGATISFGSVYTGGTDTRMSAIFGGKEDAVDGNYSGYLSFLTRLTGDSGPTERLRITSQGNIAIGTSTSESQLFVTRPGSWAANGKALAILDQTEDQDIFTASSSGTTRFTINNNGDILGSGTLTGLTGLTSSGTITFSGLSTNYGLLYTNSGVLTQVGAGATGQCLNGNSGSAPTWGSCDGALSVNVFEFGQGTAQTTNSTVDLLIGGTSTASAKFAILGVNNARGTQTATLSGSITLDAAGSLTTTNNQTLTIGGSTTGNIILDSGNDVLRFADTTLSLAAGTTINPATSGTLNIGTANVTTLGIGTITTGTTNINGGNINLNGNTNVASGYDLTVVSGETVLTGANAGGLTTLRVNNHTSGGSIAVFQNAAVDVFTIANGGGITATNTLTLSGTRLGGAAGLIVNQGGISTNDIFTASSSGITRFVINNDGTASSSAGFTINGIGNIQSTNNQTLTIGGGTTGNLVIGRTGQTTILPGYVGQNGVLFGTQTTGVLAQATTSNAGYCLLSGASAPSWEICPGGTGSTQWDIANGAIYSGNTGLDFLLGGNSTDSAKFAILGVNNARGSQTASVSGNLVLDAAGNIQTTKNQTLTIGGDTTGNIVIKPQNGANGANLTLYGNATISGSLAAKTGRGATLTVAASNSSATAKAQADYVADGTGDQTEINAAITALPSGGGSVVLLEGNYSVSGTILITKSNVSLIGSGKSTLITRGWNEGSANTSGVITVGDNSAAYTGITISQLSISGNKATYSNSNNHGILLRSNISQSKITNNWIYDAAGAGINLYYGTNPITYVTVDSNDIRTSDYGISNSVNSYITISNNSLISNVTYGMYTNSTHSTIAGNIVRFGSYSIYGIGNFNTITDNIFTNSSSISIAAGTSSDNIFSNNQINDPGSYAVYIADGSSRNLFSNNRFYNSPSIAILEEIGDNDYNRFIGNYFYDASGSGSAIAITAGEYSYFSGNSFAGGGSSGISATSSTIYGAQIVNSSGDTSIASRNLGIGTTTPTALLHATGGYGNNAAMILNQTNIGNIFAASASGVTRFVITNDGTASSSAGFTVNGAGNIQSTNGQTLTIGGGSSGNLVIGQSGKEITLPGYVGQNGVLFGTQTTGVLAQATTSNTGYCLLSGASAPSWGVCPGGSTAPLWDVADGAIYTGNTGLDFFLGGTSTGSAKFAVLGINNARGQQTASVSGNLVLDAAGSLQTTLNQLLTIGGSTTGNITLSPLNGAGTVTVNGTLAAKTGRGATLTVAASDSSATAKAQADYVADGTGDQTEINAAITALPAGGGSVVLLEGTYTVSGTILIAKSNVSLIGSGRSTVITRGWNETVANTSGVITIGDNSSAYTGVTVSQLSIDGERATYTNDNNHGILLRTRITQSRVTNTWLYDNRGDGIILSYGGTVSTYNIIDSNDIRSGTGSGIEIDNASYTTITNNTIVSTGIGIAGIGVSNSLISGNTLRSNSTGMYIAGANSTISNNNVLDSAADGISLESPYDFLISNNYLATNAGTALYLAYSSQNIIDGNKLFNNGGNIVQAEGTNSYNQITNNNITDSTGSGYAIDLFTSASENTYLASNTYSGAGVASGIRDNGIYTKYGSQTTNTSGDIAIKSRNLGVGTTAPTAVLHVTGGYANNAAMILNQTNSGNIFAASASGITRFVIANDGTASSSAGFTVNGAGNIQSTNNQTLTLGGGSTGNLVIGRTGQEITLPGYVGQNGVLFGTQTTGVLAQAATSNVGYCLLSGASAPSWEVCPGGTGSTQWDIANGTIYSGNTGLDFLLGGNSTDSAKFAVLGINNARGQQTASISGNLVLDAAGSLTTTNNQTLTLGGTTTGNIILNGDGSDFVGIGTTTPAYNLDVRKAFSSSTAALQFGSNFQTTNTGAVSSGVDLTVAQNISLSRTGATNGTIYAWAQRITATSSGEMDSLVGSYMDVSGTGVVSGISAIASTNADNLNTSSLAGGAFGATHKGSGLATTVSGISTSGRLDAGSATNVYGITASAFHSSGTYTTNSYAGSFGFGFLGGNVTNAHALYVRTPVSSTTVTNMYGLYIANQSAVGNSNSYNFYSAGGNGKNFFEGRVGIGDLATNPGPMLLVSGDGRNNAAAVFNQTFTNADILAASSSGTTRFVIKNDGTASSSAGFTIDGVGNIQSTNNQTLTVGGGSTGELVIGKTGQTITLPGYVGQNGVLFGTQTTGVVAQATTSSSGLCLMSGASSPVWGTCPGGTGSTQWDIANGAIYSGNTTLDLLIGGATTESAKFAVLNMNGSGPATATVSGNLIVMPRNGAGGYVGIGTTTPTEKLTVSAGGIAVNAPAISQKGVIKHGVGASNMSFAVDVKVVGKYAYVISLVSDSLTIVDISNPAAPTQVGLIRDNGGATQMDSPLSIDVSGKYAYVTSGGDNALSIFDISNPVAPVEVGTLVDGVGATDFNEATDIQVVGKYAYITSNAPDNALTIVDVSVPSAPRQVGMIKDGAGATEMAGTWGLYVSGKYAYITSQTDDALTIIDVSNPTAPFQVSALKDGVGATELDSGTGVYVSGKYAYIATAGDDSLTIVDISNPSAPSQVGFIKDAVGATHLDTATKVVVAGKYAYLTSQTDNAVSVIDISNPASPTQVSTIVDGAGATDITAAFGLDISGKYLYVTALTDSAMTIFDISGIEASTANIGNLAANTIDVSENMWVGNGLSVGNSLNVGAGGIFSSGAFTFLTASGSGNLIQGSTTGNALLTLNQTGTQDIFQASSAGALRFRVTNDGTASSSAGFTVNGLGNIQSTNGQTLTIGGGTSGSLIIGQTGKDITLPGYVGQNGVLFGTQTTGVLAQATTASPGLCLISGASSPSWTACPGATQWNVANGAIYTGNTTLDLLLGGATTASAKFAVLGMNGTGPATASVSGNLVVMPRNGAGGFVGIGTNNPIYPLDIIANTGAAGSNPVMRIQTTVDRKAFHIINADGGAASGEEIFSLAGDNVADKAFQAGLSSDTTYRYSVLVTGETAWGAGGGSARDVRLCRSGANALYIDNSSSSCGSGGAASLTVSGNLTLGGTTITASSLTTLTTSATLGISATTLNLGGGSAATIGTVSNDDLTLTPNGSGELTLTSDFNTGINIGTSANTPAALSISGGLGSNAGLILNRVGATDDIFAASSSGVTRFVIKNDGTASSSAGFTLDGTGNIQSTRNQTLTIGGNSTGNIILNPQNAAAGGFIAPAADNVTDLGASPSARFRSIFVGPSSLHIVCRTTDGCGQTLDYSFGVNTTSGAFEIGVNGNASNRNSALAIGQGGNVSVAGTLSVGGAISSGGISGITIGTAACVTTQNGIVTGSAACPVGSTSSPFTTNLGAIVQNNTTQDVLIGGTSTASAKFGIININNGTPTATLSAGVTGGAYLSANGTLATTAKQSLNIGGTTTGTVNISSGSILGVNVGTGNTTSSDNSGAMNLSTGTTQTGISGAISLKSGNASGISGSISQVGTTKTGSNNLGVASQAVTFDSIPQDDDIILLFVASDDSPAPSPPAGFNEVFFEESIDGSGDGAGAWYKRASGEVSATYTVTFAGTNYRESVIGMVLRGASTTGNPFEVSTVGSVDFNASPIAPSINTLTDNAWHMAYFWINEVNLTGTSAPAGYTKLGGIGVAGQLVAYKTIPTAGSTGTTTITGPGSQLNLGVSLSLKPGVAGGGSGDIQIGSGNATGSIGSGDLNLSTGTTESGASGNIIIDTGASSGGVTGTISLAGTNASAVGIGTTAPTHKLTVSDSQASTASALITNADSGSNADVLALKVGATTAGSDNYFVSFLNGTGTTLGKIRGNGSGGVVYDTAGGDYAEWYKKADAYEMFSYGDLVCLTTGGVSKCTGENGSALGVISDTPGFIGNSGFADDPNYVLVGMLGQVTTRVSAENGPIKQSDFIGASSVVGVGAKAVNAGFVVGRALEDFDGTGEGTIKVSIQPTYYASGLNLGDPITSSSVAANTPNGTGNNSGYEELSARVDYVEEALASHSESIMQSLESIASLSARLSQLEEGNELSLTPFASNSGQLVSTVDNLLAYGTGSFGNASVQETLSVGNSMRITSNSIDAIGETLALQSLKQGDLDLMAGAVVITTDGVLHVNENAEFGKDVTVTGVLSATTIRGLNNTLNVSGSAQLESATVKKLNISTSDDNKSAGVATLEAGTTSITIPSSVVTANSLIFITPIDQITGQSLYIVGKSAGNSVTVGLPQAVSGDIRFNYLIIN